MEKNIQVLIDPLNNEIHLPLSFNQEILLHEQFVDKDLSIVILKPALIIVPRQPAQYLFHVRLAYSEVMILLKSEKRNGFWLISECIWDADAKVIKKLMAEGGCVTFSL
jgi:hypothetical protein